MIMETLRSHLRNRHSGHCCTGIQMNYFKQGRKKHSSNLDFSMQFKKIYIKNCHMIQPTGILMTTVQHFKKKGQ